MSQFWDLMIGDETSISIAELITVISPHTEIIFLTGSGMFPHAELFYQQNSVAAVLRKPVDIVYLNEIVSHVGRHPRTPLPDHGTPLACL